MSWAPGRHRLPISAQFRDLFNGMLNGAAYCRVLLDGPAPHDFVYLAVNPAFERLTGLTGAVGRRVTELIPGIREQDPWLLDTYARVAATGEPAHFERRVEALREWLSISVYRPEPGHFVALFDVTTQQRAQEEERRAHERLRASERRLAEVIDASTDGFWERDLVTGEVVYSARMCQLIGLPAGQGYAGQHDWAANTHPDDLPGERAKLEAFLEGGAERFDTTFRSRRPDGGWRWVRHRGKVTARDASGRPLRLTGTATDVHDLRIALASLAESEERFAAVLEGSQDGYVDIDVPSGRVHRSQRYWELAGWPPASREATPAAFLALVHPDDAARVAPAVDAILSGATVQLDEEYRLRSSAGAYRWVRSRLRTLSRDGGGRPLRIAGTLSDAEEHHREQVRALDEARLRGLSSRMNEAEFVLDERGRILEANDRAVQLHGRAREALVGADLCDLRAPEARADVPAPPAWAGPEGLRFESTHLRADGATFPVEVSARPFEVGGARYIHCVVRDLTEQRRQEAGLRLLARLTASMSDAVAVVDEGLRIVEYTGASEAIYGWTREEVLGKSLTDFRTEYLEGDPAVLRQRLEAGEPVRTRVRAFRKDGSAVELDRLTVPLRDEVGRRTGWLSVARDISAQVRAEAALRAREAQLRAYFESPIVGVVVTDAGGPFLEVNDAFCAMLGYSREEVLARTWRDLTHPDDLARDAAAVARLAAGELEPFVVDKRYLHKGGDVVWARLALSRVRDEPRGRTLLVAVTQDVSKRKRAEAALQASEERLRSVVESMAEGVVMLDADGRIATCNAAAERILGLARAQLEGRTSLDPRWRAVHEDGSPFPGEAHPATVTLRTGQRQAGVLMGVHKPDGDLTWISINSEPLRPAPGASTHAVVATFSDVTAQRLAARRLEESERRLQLTLEASHDGTFDWDVAAGTTATDRRFAELLGMAPEAFPSTQAGLAALVHPEDLPALLAAWQRLLAGADERLDQEYRARNQAGGWVWLRGRAKVVARAADGAALRITGTITDVTDRRLAADRLQAAEALARSRATQLADALAASRQVVIEQFPLEGRRTAGPEWTAVTGRAVEEGLDRERWLALIHPDDREGVRAGGDRCFRGEAPSQEGEFRVAQPQGGWRWLRISARCDQRSPDGRPARIVGTIMDVTALRELQERVGGAQRLAATGTLARGMAHELNSPLASVTANLAYAQEQLAAAGALGPRPGPLAAALEEAQEALRDAAESAHRIRDIVVDLRTFALGELPAGRAAPSLADAVGDARRVAGQELARCRTVEVGVPPGLHLPIPHQELVQLLAHLLYNAGQATGPGPNDVRIEGRVLPDGRLELRVSDTGLGMSEATRRRAFEPFFTTRAVGHGRGLGLSVCEGIVHAAGGEIALESAEGKGTAVTVTLPLGGA